MKKEEIQKIKNLIDRGYNDRDDYPPFALNVIEDRNRYRAYIFKILDEQEKI
jgi:hypothetical protein